MDLLLNRYRNVTVLLVAILVQLVLLAYQVKSNTEVRLIRVWAVTAVTPLARVLENSRSSASHFFHDYFILLDVREENQRLKLDLNRTQLENQQLRTELSTADRATALAIFQHQTPMKTVAAHIIANTTDLSGKSVFIDRGAPSGIQKEMAVITPDGIVGKVISVYPTASSVLLITDQNFSAGVVSQKNHVRGTLRGQGNSTVMIDYVQNEQTVDLGEWFFTSGDDRIFPKGLPVGTVNVVRLGRARKEIFLNPSGLQNGLEEVLVVVEGVHAPIPDLPSADQPVHIQAPPPSEDGLLAVPAPVQSSAPGTEADRIKEQYRQAGKELKLEYGERGRGAPNFNSVLPGGVAPVKPNPVPPASPAETPAPRP